MNRVLTTLKTRISLKPHGMLLMGSLRAPKGGGKVEAAQGATTDYVGIFKDRPEPPLRRVDEYPEWLIDACMPKQNLFTLISTWRAGEKTEYPKPKANEVLRILHQIKKMKITEMNKYILMNKDIEKLKDQAIPDKDEIKYDLYEILEGRRKQLADEGGADPEEDEEEEEEEEAPKRKGVPNYDDEKDTGQKAPAAAAPAKGGKKK